MLQVIKCFIGYTTLLCVLFSGLILNLTQLIVYVIINPISKSLFRTVNSYILWSLWSQSVAYTDNFTNIKCRLYFEDKETLNDYADKTTLLMVNHRYDIDWLAVWLLSDKYKAFGYDKAMMKSSLLYLPVFGWTCAVSDMIIVSRDWKKDRDNLARIVDGLLTYPQVRMTAFFEGTRFTRAKHEASLKFCEERNLSIRLKHHLLPRTRGFHLMLERIKNAIKKDPKLRVALLNVQVATENDDNTKVSLSSVISGEPSCVHIYVGRLNINEVPIDDEDQLADYLYKVYKKKDELHEHFLRNNRFPGIEVPYRPRTQTLLNWLGWMLVIYLTFFYVYVTAFYNTLTGQITTSGLIYITFLSSMALFFLVSIRLMINSTKVSKSSSYGTTQNENRQKVD